MSTITYTGVNGGNFNNFRTGPGPKDDVTDASIGVGLQQSADSAKVLYDFMTRYAYTDGVRGFNGRATRPGATGLVSVADGDKAIGVTTGSGVDYSGKRFRLFGNPVADRVITLKHTGAVPVEGETLEIFWFSTLFANGKRYSFKREDATEVAYIWASGDGIATTANCWIEFEYVSGVWRLGRNSGNFVDTTPELCGVIPGSGA